MAIVASIIALIGIGRLPLRIGKFKLMVTAKSTKVASHRRRLAGHLRNIAMRIVGPDIIGRLWWRLRGRQREHLVGDRRSRFEFMYRTGFWIAGQKEGPLSGWGSSLVATQSIREELPKLLSQIGATSLLDVGCGDFTWMKEIDLPCPYTGLDIVPALIAENEAKFGSPTRTFLAMDACEDDIPKADAVLCREVIFHLSFRDAKKLLENVKNSNARYFLATSNPSLAINLDIPSGEHSDRNLEIAPFKLGPPAITMWDGALAQGRVLGLWKLR